MAMSMYSASVPVFQHMLRNLTHILDKGEANAHKDEDFEKTAKTKEEVVKAVKAVFDYCDGAFKNLTDATLKETYKSGTREVPKSQPTLLVVGHNMEHYGNIVTYMRLKGLVPPSSEPAPAPAKRSQPETESEHSMLECQQH